MSFIQAAATCGDLSYPLTKTDIQYIAKHYLDSKGRTIRGLKDNKTGIDWVGSLLTQPLYVSFHRAMKGSWRKVLLSWKLKNLNLTTLPNE